MDKEVAQEIVQAVREAMSKPVNIEETEMDFAKAILRFKLTCVGIPEEEINKIVKTVKLEDHIATYNMSVLPINYLLVTLREEPLKGIWNRVKRWIYASKFKKKCLSKKGRGNE